MRASLFITCYNDTLFPETGRAVVTPAGAAGGRTGFPSRANLLRADAREYRVPQRGIQPGQAAGDDVQDAEAVVIPSSSCVAMIRDQYPGLFEELGNEGLRKEFAALLPRVYELSEFLIDKLGVEDVGAYFPHKVTYHASCHGLRACTGRSAVPAAEQSARTGAGAACRTSIAAADSAERSA